jgi:hypothetical protein
MTIIKKKKTIIKKKNQWGCRPMEDVCMEHDEPLDCRHGCSMAREHQCIEHGPGQIAGPP